MLSKSNDLNKSALNMNQHYLELKMFLQEVENHPEVVMDKDYKVFRSEDRLYGDAYKLIASIQSHNQCITNCLYKVRVTLLPCIHCWFLEQLK